MNFLDNTNMKFVIQGELANKDAKKVALLDTDKEVALTYIVAEGTSRFCVLRSINNPSSRIIRY